MTKAGFGRLVCGSSFFIAVLPRRDPRQFVFFNLRAKILGVVDRLIEPHSAGSRRAIHSRASSPMSNRAITHIAWSSHREKGQKSPDFLSAIVPRLQTLVGQVSQSAAVKSKSPS